MARCPSFLRIEKVLIRESYPKGLRMPTEVGSELRQLLPKSDGLDLIVLVRPVAQLVSIILPAQ